MDFYDIHEQTRFQITISVPEKMEELSDMFVTKEELQDLLGPHAYLPSSPTNGHRTYTLKSVIEREVKEWADKLVASGKKTLIIDDEELLDVLKQGYLSDYTEDDDRFGRHGDRICYARRYKRKKTKVTRGDVTDMWHCFQYAWRDKYGCYLPHIPRYDRGINLFKALKDVVGWRRMRKHISDEKLKFYRMIWDNPEEHV